MPVFDQRDKTDLVKLMRKRDFAYSEVYNHPPVTGDIAFYTPNAVIRPDIPPEIATLCKNESNTTVFLNDGTWFTTWSQGSYEHAVDERIVFAVSKDEGKTWTAPQTIVRSNAQERIAYGAPFVIPDIQRIYLFFFAGAQTEWSNPGYDAGMLNFMYSDNAGRTWSKRHPLRLPSYDLDVFPDRIHGWVNHPPVLMSTGEVLLTFSVFPRVGLYRRAWRVNPAEVRILHCQNILEESNPDQLRFTVLPEGGRGIRVNLFKHRNNPSLVRLLQTFGGYPEDSGFNFQEMTIISLSDGRWVGVGRTFLGSPGYTVSTDYGHTWSEVEPLCYHPDGEPIRHPMTMCPLAKLSDGRVILLFTNNDGFQRGAQHVWDGNGKTRNPQWFSVGREIPGEPRNGGLIFGKPKLLAEVDDRKEGANLKTGISMPQFFERDGRYFVCYNINKEHLLLDEIPAGIIAEMTP